MHENWKIDIQNRVNQFITDIYIYRRAGEQIETIEGNEYRQYSRGCIFPPSFSISSDLVPLLAEAIAKSGVKLPDESFVKGKLEATEKHLSDMRKIVFEPIVTGTPKNK